MFQDNFIKVDQQTDLPSAKTQIGQQLSFMNRCDTIDGL